ncbi:unnamed protein product [Rhizophagus irregularis]|nr:unnamed protein product [Rhizophagus irregularis]
MENLTGKRASIATLWRSLHYLGITRKKLQKEAYERSEIMRAHYLGIIDGFVAVDVFEGACNKNKFVKFVLDQVVPKDWDVT